jgi:hypothetical protein
MRALIAYASPVMSALTAAATARPASESYGTPLAMRSAPRFA